MADDQHCARVIRNHFLQQIERFQIEIVGRLVQHQQVGSARKFARQQDTATFPAGKGADFRIHHRWVEQEVLEIGGDMLAYAVHVDPVTAFGQNIAHGFLWVEQFALLIDHHARQRLGQRDLSCVGCEFAGQHIEQRGFARAICADNADPVTALDAQRKRLDDRALAKGFGDVLRHDHRLRFELTIAGQLQLGRASRAHHGRARLAHFPQFRQSALVALAPGGDAAFEPMRFDLQPRVHPLRVARFVGIDFVFPRLVPAKADVAAAHIAPVEPHGGVGQALEERPVMADDHERPAIAA